MVYRSYLIVISLFLCLPVVAQQTTADKELELSFKEALEIALKENVILRQEMNLLEIEDARHLREKFRYLPSLSANVRLSQLDGQQFDQVQGVLAFTKSDRVNGSLDANLTLFDGFSRIKSIKQANYRFKAQEKSVERARQQLIFDVSQQYLQILLSKQLEEIAEDNFKLQNAILNQIAGFVEAGTRAKPDLYTQQAQVEQQRVLHLRASNDLRGSKARLIQTLLLDPGVALDPVEPEWSADEILAQAYELQDLYEVALRQRPDYLQRVNTVEADRQAIGVATSGYYPTLTAFFSYGSSYSSLVANSTFISTGEYDIIGYVNGDEAQPVQSAQPNFRKIAEPVEFSEQFFDSNLSTIFGLNFSIPIFDRFQTRTNRVMAKLQYENSQLTEENMERVIFLEVQNAYLDFEASKREYLASQKQYQAAEKALEVQQERYHLGISNLVELSQASNIYVQGAASKAQAEYTLLFQKIILDYYLGTLKYEDIP